MTCITYNPTAALPVHLHGGGGVTVLIKYYSVNLRLFSVSSAETPANPHVQCCHNKQRNSSNNHEYMRANRHTRTGIYPRSPAKHSLALSLCRLKSKGIKDLHYIHQAFYQPQIINPTGESY